MDTMLAQKELTFIYSLTYIYIYIYIYIYSLLMIQVPLMPIVTKQQLVEDGQCSRGD